MMSSASSKTPPLLQKSNLYSDWKKKVTIWDTFTTLEESKKGATLEGSAEDIILEQDPKDINCATGLKNKTSF